MAEHRPGRSDYDTAQPSTSGTNPRQYHVPDIDAEMKIKRTKKKELSFNKRLREIVVYTGETAFLRCKVDGVYEKGTWYKSGKPIEFSGRINSTALDDGSHELQISDVQLSDFGTYAYVCFNEKCYIASEAVIHVLPEPASQNQMTVVGLHVLIHQIRVIRHLQNVMTNSGSGFVLNAKFESGNSANTLQYIWYKDNLPITSTEKYLIKNTSNSTELAVVGAQVDDSGVYVVVVEGSYGIASTYCNVNILDVDLRSLTFKQGNVCIKEFPLEIPAVIGEEVTLHCELYNYERFEITWVKDVKKFVLIPGTVGRRVFVSYGRDAFGMKILCVQSDDFGQYSVIVKDPVTGEKSWASCYVSISTLPRRPLYFSSVKNSLKSVVTVFGASTFLTCAFHVYFPYLTYAVWRVGRHTIYRSDGQFEVINDRGNCLLYIKQVLPDMIGEVTCELRSWMSHDRSMRTGITKAFLIQVPRTYFKDDGSLLMRLLSPSSYLGNQRFEQVYPNRSAVKWRKRQPWIARPLTTNDQWTPPLARRDAVAGVDVEQKESFGAILCNECYMIICTHATSNILPGREFGHIEVCFGCGSSILRARTYRVSAECPERHIIYRMTPAHQATFFRCPPENVPRIGPLLELEHYRLEDHDTNSLKITKIRDGVLIAFAEITRSDPCIAHGLLIHWSTVEEDTHLCYTIHVRASPGNLYLCGVTTTTMFVLQNTMPGHTTIIQVRPSKTDVEHPNVLVCFDLSLLRIQKHKPRVPLNSEGDFKLHFSFDEKTLGGGGFSKIMQVSHKKSGTLYAGKCVNTVPLRLRYMAFQEFTTLRVLNHPNVVTLIAAFPMDNLFVMLLEILCGGELLRRILHESRAEDLTDICCTYIRQLCEALKYVHIKNFVHMDIKSENVLCVNTNTRQIKLIDFGLAICVKPVERRIRYSCGTKHHMSPEAVMYRPVTTSTDMWSLGVLVYIMLSGVIPFARDGQSWATHMKNIIEVRFNYDQASLSTLSDEARHFIDNLLVRHSGNVEPPKERHPSNVPTFDKDQDEPQPGPSSVRRGSF